MITVYIRMIAVYVFLAIHRCADRKTGWTSCKIHKVTLSYPVLNMKFYPRSSPILLESPTDHRHYCVKFFDRAYPRPLHTYFCLEALVGLRLRSNPRTCSTAGCVPTQSAASQHTIAGLAAILCRYCKGFWDECQSNCTLFGNFNFSQNKLLN